MGLYQIILLVCLIAELWFVIKMATSVKSLEASQSLMNQNAQSTYDIFESGIAKRFNAFFFGAASTCNGACVLLF